MDCEIGNDVGCLKVIAQTGAGHRLEAYATLCRRLVDPERTSFKTLSEQLVFASFAAFCSNPLRFLLEWIQRI